MGASGVCGRRDVGVCTLRRALGLAAMAIDSRVLELLKGDDAHKLARKRPKDEDGAEDAKPQELEEKEKEPEVRDMHFRLLRSRSKRHCRETTATSPPRACKVAYAYSQAL